MLPATSSGPANLIIDSNASSAEQRYQLQDRRWIPMQQRTCDFGPELFEQVSRNLVKNPNINSSHLFRADILYDSLDAGNVTRECPLEDVRRMLRDYILGDDLVPGFAVKRTIIRLMVPRNPQLDRPIAQTCYFLSSIGTDGIGRSLVVYVPHVSELEALPWYHPAVQYLAYLHTWLPPVPLASHTSPQSQSDSSVRQGTVSIHFCLFPSQTFPLPPRLLRTAEHLLATLHKHGQGCHAGYTKRVHHDQLISQQRVQDTYAELKRKHAKRLCSSWVERTEPSKHVFEDLGIAAFLIELWRDMYRLPEGSDFSVSRESAVTLPPFPGFVDIGCGNGVLTEILMLSGYRGWGFDARQRKTWKILSPGTKAVLKEMILIPAPLFDLYGPAPRPKSLRTVALSVLHPSSPSSALQPPAQPWHNGIFPTGTFVISNHADELTSWTPLLASLSHSPFLAIPCCSHNLSGIRFRAPTHFNSHTADSHAPVYFAKNVTKGKSVPISIAAYIDSENGEGCHENEPQEKSEGFTQPVISSSDVPAVASDFAGTVLPAANGLHESDRKDTISKPKQIELLDGIESDPTVPRKNSSGDLRSLAVAARAKQPSAYSSLCDWVSQLSTEVGYVVEREMLRIPSTRNVGIIGRAWLPDSPGPADSSSTSVRSHTSASLSSTESGLRNGSISQGNSPSRRPFLGRRNRPSPEQVKEAQLVAARRERVVDIARREGADGKVWIKRCIGLGTAKGEVHA
ncbi:tRNA(Ser) Um(44) 2'-O-methyltransferase [Xylographa opegraphella]|nr:tRNA(Ser) Um(44) 2'-O-methyltransferase [Xylographa opegraphella]